MSQKPTYEELEQRVRELENAETERKQAEEALRESELFMRETQTIAKLGGWKTNPRTDTLEWNDGVYDIIEEPRDYRPGLAEGVKYYHSEYLPALQSCLENCLATGNPFTLEAEITTAKGNHRWVEVRAFARTDSGGEPMVMGTIQDITDRRQAESDLQESEERYRRITAGVTDYIYTVRVENGNAVETTHSPACETVTGYTAEEFAADPYIWVKMLAEEDRDRVIDHVRDVYEGKEPRSIEHRIVRKDGRTVWVSFTTIMKYGANGQLASYDGIIKDITERKRAEEALRESETTVRKKLQSILEPESSIETLDLADIIDYQALQTMMENFYRITHIGSAVVDLTGKVLVATGWQDVCTKFHRVNPATLKNCRESDIDLSSDVPVGTFKAYRCKNNLWDIATPIVVGGRHLGNVFLGQFFYEDEVPDYELFRSQARQYGFDEREYLAAVDRVPRWSRETVELAMTFYAKLAGMISTLSYSTVNLSRALSQQDVTLRRLGESESRNKAILSAMPDMMFLFDHNGVFLDYHAPNESELVTAPESFVGRRVHDVLPQDIAEITMFHINEILENGDTPPYGYEIEIAGETRFYESRMVKCEGTGFLAIVRDITSRKKSEEELWKRENILQRIFEILPIGLWFADKDGTLLRGNPMGDRIWGAEPKASISEYGVFKAWRLPSREPVGPDDWALAKTIRNGATIVDELLEIQSFDGKRKIILNYTAPVLDDNGNVDGAIVVNLDITDRKALESRLVQAQKMESIGTLAGGIAHDFNNILSIIVGNTEMAMLDVPEWSPARDNLKEVREATLRARELVKQILMFARKKEHTVSNISLEPIAKESLRMLRATTPTTVKIHEDIEEKLPSVLADASQLQQIIMNLCANAGQAMEAAGGTLTFTLDSVELETPLHTIAGELPTGQYVRMQVKDTGPGIPPEMLDRLFDPFFTTKGVGQGTGLGLPVVHGIVQDRKGGIIVDSEEGRGTTFTIYLPASEGQSVEVKAEQETEVPRGTERILFVDDEPMLIKMGRQMLERLGYNVETRTSGTDALECFKQDPHRFDLVITDMTMPGMRGDRLAEEILASRKDIPVILCTGYSTQISKVKAEETGIRAFVMKPLTQHELANTVRRVLDEKSRK